MRVDGESGTTLTRRPGHAASLKPAWAAVEHWPVTPLTISMTLMSAPGNLNPRFLSAAA